MATDDGDVDVGGVLAHVLAQEGVGAADVEGGDAADLLGVVDALGLEDLGGDRDGAIHRIGDDGEDCVGAMLGTALDKGLDDGGVRVEKVVAGHAGLARDASRDYNNGGTGECGL